MPMSAPDSSSTPKQSSSEATQRADSGQRAAPRRAGESPGPVQVEQSVAVAPDFEATETRYRDGLIHIFSQVASDPSEVNHAVEDLRALIEETVRREVGLLRGEFDVLRGEFGALRGEFGALRGEFDVLRGEFGVLRKEMDLRFEALGKEMGVLRKEMGVLRKEIDVRFDAMQKEMDAAIAALQSENKTLRWMMGAVITMMVALFASHVALIVLLVNMVLSEDRSGTPLPPPPNATVQAPAGTETAPPTGAVLGSEAAEVAAPGGQSATADPPDDQPTP